MAGLSEAQPVLKRDVQAPAVGRSGADELCFISAYVSEK
jgi:hypothetical protein